MLGQFITVGLLMLLAVMLPGPDFALVTKNTLFSSRRAGLYTSLGIGCSNLVHISYCILGLAIVISNSLILFNLIKFLGAFYMIYLGTQSLLSKPSNRIAYDKNEELKQIKTSNFAAFREGFVCNLLNPKATLFFLALFTVILPEITGLWGLAYAIEMFVIITGWFFCLTFILSLPSVFRLLNKAEKYIAKALGLFLIGFGIALTFLQK